jgi:hypothetical protein
MPPRKHALLTKEVLLDLYFDQKFSMPRIAEMRGVPYSVVRASFRACGLRWRTKSEARAGRSWNEATKAKISAAHLGRKDSPETAAKKRAALARVCAWTVGVPYDDPRRVRQRKAVADAMRRPEVRERCSIVRTKMIQSGRYYSRGYYQSPKAGRVYYMSGWELRRYKEFDADPCVACYSVQPCSIPYLWDGSTHRYIPDVLVEYVDGSKVLEEIKPLQIVERDAQGSGRIAVKLRAGETFAQQQGWGWRLFSYGVA